MGYYANGVSIRIGTTDMQMGFSLPIFVQPLHCRAFVLCTRVRLAPCQSLPAAQFSRSLSCNLHLVLHHVPQCYVRSEERRVGKECVSTCRSRWSTYH